MPRELIEKVQIVMHLPEGYTKVRLDRFPSCDWDIPTSEIPLHLRSIGSRFIVQTTALSGALEAANLSPEEIRSIIRPLSVREIKDE